MEYRDITHNEHMTEPWIIEKIREEEETRKKQKENRPHAEIPLYPPRDYYESPKNEPDPAPRGGIIIGPDGQETKL